MLPLSFSPSQKVSGSYNLRSRSSETTQKPRKPSPTPRPPPQPAARQSTPVKRRPGAARPYSMQKSSGADTSESCRILWSLFMLIATFAVVFLLYEHFTVPEGNTSLLVSGYHLGSDMVNGFISPLMASQKVESETEGAAEEKQQELPKEAESGKKDTSPPDPAEKEGTKEESKPEDPNRESNDGR